MFKNEINFSQSHPLSKKEKKEIFKTLSLKYEDEYIKYMISNFNELSIQKGNIQNKKRNVLFNGNNPILFEIDKDKYIPTVYLLQYFNLGLGINLIKNVCIIYDATVEYILNGADLMLKGVINRNQIKNSERNFGLEDIFYVQTQSGKIVAIGCSLVDKNLMNIEQPSGKFLKIIQRIGDSLWNIGCKKEIPHLDIPINNTYINDYINNNNNEDIKEDNNDEEKKETNGYNVEEKKNDNNKNNEEDENNNNNEDIKENNKNNEDIKEDNKNNEDIKEDNKNNENIKEDNNNNEDIKEENNNNEDIKEDNNNNEDIKEDNNSNEDIKEDNNLDSNEENNNEEYKKIELPSKEEIDEYLDIVFLTLCKLHLQEEKFPMDPGKLYTSFMKPLSKELKLFIDIKFSSHKKVNDYFKYLSKEKKYLTFSKAKGQNNLYIQSINFDNEDIKNFKPRVNKLKFLSHQNKEESENILLSKDEKIEIVSYYKPQQKLHPLFNKYLPNFSTDEFYPMKECKKVLTNYLKDNNLFIQGTNNVKLDSNLEKMLNIHYTTFSIEERQCKMDEIMEMWNNNLIAKNFIIKTSISENKSETVKAKNLTIRIIAKKIRNKNVTLVSGLENYIDNINTICKSLAKHFATSVTVKDEIFGLKNAIFIQGHWVDELVEKLIEEFKINKRIIKVEDRLKTKKKK